MAQITIDLPEQIAEVLETYGLGLFESNEVPDVLNKTASMFFALGMQKHVEVMTGALMASGDEPEQFYVNMLGCMGMFAAQTLDELPVYLDVTN